MEKYKLMKYKLIVSQCIHIENNSITYSEIISKKKFDLFSVREGGIIFDTSATLYPLFSGSALNASPPFSGSALNASPLSTDANAHCLREQ
ncbi:hypothetical protein OUZ56_021421 [Daphnia magna]|uniref:Uncharacterized protein n=1 Tax=Daphnia magna TaxID=35525 RepID=A0ABQ9ZHB8_9CRUS|nr:hypothetical protein OUZ56_021421 [Daphnia magna]